jgi:hypothetical protein
MSTPAELAQPQELEHATTLSKQHPVPTGNPEASLLRLQQRGYCTDEWWRWQQGQCGTYAVALMRLRPQLRFGTHGITRAGGGDASSGWSPEHHFAHDDTYAYDSAGRHPLPYHGVYGDADYCELDGGYGPRAAARQRPPTRVAGSVGPEHRSRHSLPLAAGTFPHETAAGLRPDRAFASAVHAAHNTARRQPDEGPRAAEGPGRR